MESLAKFIVVYTMLLCVNCQSAPQCYEESQYGPSSTLSRSHIKYVWSALDGDGVYNATPLCLDENYKIIKRNCFNGVWYPKGIRNCYDFNCPKPFIRETSDSCSYVVTLQNSTDNCPTLTSIMENKKSDDCTNCTSHKCVYNIMDFLQISPTPYDIDVSLTFDHHALKLFLNVYSSEAVDENLTRCYTNDVEADYLRNVKLVEISKLYDSRRSGLYSHYSLKNFTVYEVDVKGQPLQYWCQVFQIGRFRPITTRKVVAYKQKFGNEYSIRINALSILFETIAKVYCKECRILEVLPFNESTSVGILHLAMNGSNIAEEFASLETTLINRTSEAVRFLNMKSSEFCLPDITISSNNNKLLHWKMTKIGSVARPIETCSNTVRRKCRGDFLNGAEWGDVQGVCLDIFPNKTKQTQNILDEVRVLMSDNKTKLSNTDMLLDSLDNFVINNLDKLQRTHRSNLLLRFETNVKGLSLYSDGFQRVTTNITFQNINISNLEFAVLLPDFWSDLFVTVFRNDRLFPGKIRAGSDIVRINLSKNKPYLETPVILLFRSKGVFNKTVCAIWEHKTENYGEWSTLGANYITTVAENFTVCAFSRLGHFALAVLSDEEVIWGSSEERDENNSGAAKFNNLLLFVYASCAISITVIVGVILTTVLVKRCRRKERRK